MAQVVLAGALSFAILTPINPYLPDMFSTTGERKFVAAKYNPGWNQVRQQPAVRDEFPLSIRNTGSVRWLSRGLDRVAVSYR